MRRKASEKFLRVAMRLVDGQWQMTSGGGLPVAEGTEGEMIINIKSITDLKFLARMKARENIKFLPQGTELRAYVVLRKKEELTKELLSHLTPWAKVQAEIATEHIDNWSRGELHVVHVRVGDTTPQQNRQLNSISGGLWLMIEGRESVGLRSSQIVLPKGVADEPLISLNHAFTRLSEVYEPWRTSHTGNVYQRFLYKEADGRWYPLEILRDAAFARQEQAIAFQLWQDFLAKIAAKQNI